MKHTRYVNNTERDTMHTYLLEYIKIHKISLEQDLAELADEMDSLDMNSKDFVELDFEYNNVSGQIMALGHILDYALEIERNQNAN